MKKYDIYLYGMTLITTSYLIKHEYPKPDTYSEIIKSYILPGGETGTCAVVLSNLGTKLKIDGNHLGRNTYNKLFQFFENINIDASRMTYDKEYDGLEDMVIIDKKTRTCFGKFQDFFAKSNPRRWNTPHIEDIANAQIVGLDPFFFNESFLVAKYCKELGKKYVTIDCRYDSQIHQLSSINIISNEFINNHYKKNPIDELYFKYTNNCEGLVIFTCGSKDILYGRKGERMKRFSPYNVDVVSTLGAGDSFKAGVLYGLLKGMDDDRIVSFASATAAVACSNYPIPLYPPTLYQIQKLQNKKDMQT